MALLYSSWTFCIFIPFWYILAEKNLATLRKTRTDRFRTCAIFDPSTGCVTISTGMER
jgi:hypothetical protein